MDASKRVSVTDSPPFGKTHIHPPTVAHTHTAVMLHGRGDEGASFAEEMLGTRLSGGQTLPALLPGWRFVFPEAPAVWSAVFREEGTSWFEEGPGQAEGLHRAVDHVREVLAGEAALLRERGGRVVLGGISQGGAVGMWTMLAPGGDEGVAGFWGVSTWLPLGKEGEEQLIAGRGSRQGKALPVFMGHGLDDAYVDVELGREAARALGRAGFEVERREYTGADQGGHWFKEPEGLDDLYEFMVRVTTARS